MISEIIQKYETPLYYYDGDKIEANTVLLKGSLIQGSTLYFSMKANPLLGLCRIMNDLGCGIEVASKGELFVALEAGVNPDRIIFTGPGKTYEELKYAVKKHIHIINIESLEEVKMINDIAEKQDCCVNVAIRVNPKESKMNAKIKMSGVSSQFGIEESSIDEDVIDFIKNLSNIKLVGIQVYMGTQILDAEDIIANTEYIIQLGIGLSQKYNFDLKYLNLGGGFGVPYFNNDEPLQMDKLKDGMIRIKEKYKTKLDNAEIVFESGRFILADAGKFITKVLYKKESKGKKYIVCDGGSNFHAASAFLGRIIRNNYPMYSIPDSEDKEEITVTGPLCTPTDVIGQSVEINKYIEEGDFIVIDKAGAYGITYSPYAFLGHRRPIEIMSYKNDIYVLRKRGEIEDALLGQNMMCE